MVDVLEDTISVAEDSLQPYRNEVGAKLAKPFAQNLIKQRQGAKGMMLDYVPGHTVIYRLMSATDNDYSFTYSFPPIIQSSIENVYNKNTKKYEDKMVHTLIVGVELTIPGLGTRAGLGVQKMQSASEDMLKGALTDALKNAAKYFGVALNLYGSDDEGENEPDF